jgi:hypothetical protein
VISAPRACVDLRSASLAESENVEVAPAAASSVAVAAVLERSAE